MTTPTDAELITFLKQEAEVHLLESCDGESVATWLMKAADRLAALSAEVDMLEGMYYQAKEDRERLTAEVERLHEVLRGIEERT